MKLPESPPPPTKTTVTTSVPNASNASNANTSVKAPALTGQQLVSQLKLQPGQTLNIQVVHQKGNQLSFSLPQLPGKTFQAETDNALKSGQAYQVKVVQTQPKLQLQLQTTSTSTQTQVLTTQALRQKLPNMQPLTQVMQQLTQPDFLKQLPANLQAGLQKLLENALKPQFKLAGSTLKTLTQQSGLFLESKLAHQQSPQGDLKAKLLQLQHQVQTQLKTQPQNSALQHTQKSLGQLLDRITLQQIESVEKGQWITEIPLQPQPYFKQLTLKIHPPSTPQSPTWQATLDLDTQDGEWLTQFFLNTDTQHLSLHLWFENDHLKQKVIAHQTELIELFEASGLKVQPLQYLPQKPNLNSIPHTHSLIDIKI